MKKLLYTLLIAIAAFSPIWAEGKAVACTLEADGIKVMKPWAKPNYGPNGAAYFTLKNTGDKPLTLLSATSPLSKRVELHEHSHENGVMKMRKVQAGLEIAPGKTLSFAPGGLHVMLFGMKQSLGEGADLPLVLKFNNGAEIKLNASVTKTPPKGQNQNEKAHQHHQH